MTNLPTQLVQKLLNRRNTRGMLAVALCGAATLAITPATALAQNDTATFWTQFSPSSSPAQPGETPTRGSTPTNRSNHLHAPTNSSATATRTGCSSSEGMCGTSPCPDQPRAVERRMNDSLSAHTATRLSVRRSAPPTASKAYRLPGQICSNISPLSGSTSNPQIAQATPTQSVFVGSLSVMTSSSKICACSALKTMSSFRHIPRRTTSSGFALMGASSQMPTQHLAMHRASMCRG